jgi:hypothetical protein
MSHYYLITCFKAFDEAYRHIKYHNKICSINQIKIMNFCTWYGWLIGWSSRHANWS